MKSLAFRCTKEREEEHQCNYANQCWSEETSSITSDSEERVESVPRVHVRTFAMRYHKLRNSMTVLRIFRYLKGTLKLGLKFVSTEAILEDNQKCIHLVKNQENLPRCKHIDTRYHFVREQVERGETILRKIDTKKKLADVFTKELDRVQFLWIISHFMHYCY